MISGVQVINSLQNSNILGVYRIVCLVEVKVTKLGVTIRLFEVSFHYTQNSGKVAYRILLSLSNLERLKDFNSAHIMVRMKS